MASLTERVFAETRHQLRKVEDVTEALVSLASTAPRRQGMVFCDLSNHLAMAIAEEVINSARLPEAEKESSPFADGDVESCCAMIAGIAGDIGPIPVDVVVGAAAAIANLENAWVDNTTAEASIARTSDELRRLKALGIIQ